MSQFTNINEMSLPKVDQAVQDVSAKLAGGQQGGENDFFVGLVGAAMGAPAVFEGVQAMMALRQNAQQQAQAPATTDFLTGKKNKKSSFFTPVQHQAWVQQSAPVVRAARGTVDLMAAQKGKTGFLGASAPAARGVHLDVHERATITSSFLHSPSKGVNDKEGLSAKTRSEHHYTLGALKQAQDKPSLSAIAQSPADQRSKSAYMRLSQDNQIKVARTMQAPAPALH